MKHHVLAAGLALAFAGTSDAAVFKVGPGPGCTHSTLAAAIAATAANGPAHDEIRLASNLENLGAAGPFVIRDQSLSIRGGFPSCSWNTPDNPRIRITSSERGSLFTVIGTRPERMVVSISKVMLQTPWGSTVRSADAGGGIRLDGNVELSLDNAHIARFRAGDGGGIALVETTHGAPRLYVANSEIDGNAAAFSGGGIDCSGRGYVRLDPVTRISNNSSVRNGGGIAARGCTVVQYGGAEIRGNAARSGGGVYASDGAFLVMQWIDRSRAPVVADNRSSRAGGGTYLTGAGTALDARGGQWLGNRTVTDSFYGDGAALLVDAGASAALRRDRLCRATADGCTRIERNSAEARYATATPSIIAVTGGASATLSGLHVSDNVATSAGLRDGAVIDAGLGFPTPSTIDVANALIRRNKARFVFGAGERTIEGNTLRSRISAQLVTEYANDPAVEALAGNPYETVAPVDLRASILLGPPLARSAALVRGTFDCLVTRLPPQVAASRSLVASDQAGSSPHVDQVLDYATGVTLAGSPAVDLCSSEGLRVADGDARGRVRPVDDPWTADRHGPVDAGAFERAASGDVLSPNP